MDSGNLAPLCLPEFTQHPIRDPKCCRFPTSTIALDPMIDNAKIASGSGFRHPEP